VVDEVRARADIVEVIGRHLTLKKSGNGFWALCPFHNEKTPSFHVEPERQIYHCFGCGEGGDLFGFRMRVESLEFPEAIRVTAREVGIEIVESGGPSGQSSKLARANEVALEYFRSALGQREGTAARRYLERRGIPRDLMERFEIGCAPPGWDGLLTRLEKASLPLTLAEQAGLVARRQTGDGHYDRLRDRVIFPIRNASGRLIGFGGRALDPEAPKYLNTPETPLYKKGQVLFGLPQAVPGFRERDRAVIVEGYFDVLALHRAGVREGVAPCGTALTQDHARRLRRYVREVVVVFDGDDAGRRAAERALPILLEAGLRVRGVFLPAGEDPDTLVSRGSEATLRESIDKASPLLDQLLEDALKEHSGHPWGAADAVQSLVPYIQALPDPVERESYLRTLASRLGLTLDTVAEALRARAPRSGQKGSNEPAPKATDRRQDERIDPVLRMLVTLLTSHPRLADCVTDDDLRSLQSRDARALVGRVLEAARSHGERALAHLLSPAEESLESHVKGMLSQITSERVPLEDDAAEQALRDCLTRFGVRALDRDSREITALIEACDDPDALSELLERKQEMLRRRQSLLGEERRE
jgi:DNA primase